MNESSFLQYVHSLMVFVRMWLEYVQYFFKLTKLMFYHPISTATECIVMTSCEQRLVTKEHITMHTNLILWFNPLNTQVL